MKQEGWKTNIAVYMSAQGISLFGSSLVQHAITWYITLTTQSGVYATLAIICGFLPTLFLSPFAGVWADRYDRKRLIMIADAGIALSTLVLAILFLSGYQAIWLLLVTSALRALGGSVQTPAVSAMIPQLVPEEHLTRINGINGTLQSLLALASPALAGALLSTIGSIEMIFFIDVGTAMIAIFIMLRFLHVPVRAKQPRPQGAGFYPEIGEGVRYIRKHSFLLQMFMICVVIYIGVAPVSFLTPLQVVRSYGEEYWRLTAVEVAFSVGMLLGGLLISLWPGFKNRVNTIMMALTVLGVFTFTLGLGLPFWLYMTLLGVMGMSLPFFNTPAVVILQEKVDSAYMGRVFSVLSMISGSAMPLGMVVFGPLADRFPIEILLFVSGGMILLATMPLSFSRHLRAAGIPNAKKPLPE